MPTIGSEEFFMALRLSWVDGADKFVSGRSELPLLCALIPFRRCDEAEQLAIQW